MGVIKKTVAIHPIVDTFIRKTWAMLIENGFDATYSTALNFILLGVIIEVTKKEGWSREAREVVWKSLKDEKIIKEFNITEQLSIIVEEISRELVKEVSEVFKNKK
jgi:hypothetical protein